MNIRQNRSICYILPALGPLFLIVSARADEIVGFTEPRYHIMVAAQETGIISKLHVREGEQVSAGQVLAVLDDDVLKASLAIAKKAKESLGAIRSAEAELALKKERVTRFHELRRHEHASVEEVERAVMELEVAEARLLAVQEAQEIKELEFQRAQAQINNRQVRSPINGVVTEIHKDPGEFASPVDSVVFTVVQLDPLIATFSIPAAQAEKLTPGQRAVVQFESRNLKAIGKISFVSPVVDAQSATVKVKIEIPNAEGHYQSGHRCQFIPEAIPSQLTQQESAPR